VSGYFGVVRLDGKRVDEDLIARIAERLAFRGPHGTQTWSGSDVGGCFTLMRTGSASQLQQQPLVLGERLFLWGDVRLDAQADLRSNLAEPSLTRPLGETSEELLLLAWNRWGERALDYLIGDFSFGLWDARERRLACARDLIGTRPLYYAHLGDVLYFGNTLGVFLGAPEVSTTLDELFIADFLTQGFCDEPDRTAFRDVKRLPSGHILNFSSDGIQVRRFRKLPVEEPIHFAKEDDYIQQYLELLREAVRDRLPQGPASLYLSGGLDSASVCAIAAEIAGTAGAREKLRAFTLGWQPVFDDPEPKFAGLTATHLGLPHELLTSGELVAFEGANSQGWALPEPSEAYFYLRHKRQVEKIASFSNVVLGGDGGDDVLSDQSWPYLVQLWRKGDWKKLLYDFGGYFWSHRQFPPLGAGLRDNFVRTFRPRDRFEGYPRWLNPTFEAKLRIRERWCQSSSRPADEHPLHPSAYRALHDGLWASAVEMEDAGWIGAPLEMRAPLLDLRVLRYLLRLPTLPWCVRKELSRRAMKTRLPDAVIHRPKTPLLHDPLGHSSLPSGWPERLGDSGTESLERFVNWQKWCETLREPEGSLSWHSLRPISLLLWLKAVEFRMGFK